MVFPIAGGTQDTSYEISNSLMFEDGDGADLSRTPSANGNRKTFTFSTWLKIGNIPTADYDFFSANTTNNFNDVMRIRSDESLQISATVSGDNSNGYKFRSDMKFRDPSAWYHIVVAVDTTQATNSNGLKIYVNGSLISGTYDSYNQNISTSFNKDGSTMSIGHRENDGGNHYDGYISETHFIDGSQLDSSYFGKTDNNGVWVPKQYTGSYGTNGFFLEFKQTGTSANSSGIGADTSGNDNHFTPTNLAAIDVTTDTPQNNFSTLESLQQRATYGMPTLSEGNLKFGGSGHSSSWGYRASNIEVSSGKWYCEIKCSGNSHANIGIFNTGYYEESHFLVQNPQNQTGFYGLVHDGATVTQKRINGSLSSASITQFNDGDIVGVYLNVDDKELQFYVNGGIQTDFGTVDISAGTRDGYRFVAITSNGSGTEFEFNFGNPTFSISSGNSDANGYGNFEYAPPSGYYSLCTKNLAEFG